MRKHMIFKAITAILLITAMVIGIVGCSDDSSKTDNSGNNDSAANNNKNDKNDKNDSTPTVNTSPINVVWYPNESSNTHTEIRAEVARLIEQATNRKVNNVTTTDYTIAIEAIASGSADIAISMGAVGYIEAKNKNPQIDVLFVNADKNGKIDEAKYFSWICVSKDQADQYKSGDSYSIENIKGKKMSFVSNSSTSGFKVPTAGIIEFFKEDNLTADDLIEGGSKAFFGDVYFGGSHQGSAINLITGNAEVAAFCDIELAPYIELKEGTENTVGAVYEVIANADAPFDVHVGKEFVVIACTPVFNGPNVYNPKNLSAAEIKAIQDLFTSPEVANNELIFFDPDVEGAMGLYKKTSSYGYVLTSDSWYDAYRK